MQGVITQQPRFADLLVLRPLSVEPFFQSLPAPGHGPQERREADRIQWWGRHHHLASASKGWLGPLVLGLGRPFKIASARSKSLNVVTLMLLQLLSTM